MKTIFSGGLLILVLLIQNCVYIGRCVGKNSRNYQRIDDERYRELLEHSDTHPIIKMSTTTLKEYLKPPARNYSLIVSYRLSGYKIPPILLSLYDYFKTIAYSYNNKMNDKKIFFVVIYDNNELQRLCDENDYHLLPLIIHYPPDGTYTKIDIFDMRWSMPSLQSLLQFIRQRTKVDVKLEKNINALSIIMMLFTLVMVLLSIYYFYDVINKLNTKLFWSTTSIIFITTMFSGYMLNRINGTTFMGSNDIFNSDMRQQYGIESVVLFVSYMIIIISFIMLNNINNNGVIENGFSIQKMFKIGYELFCVLILGGGIIILYKIIKNKIAWYPLLP